MRRIPSRLSRVLVAAAAASLLCGEAFAQVAPDVAREAFDRGMSALQGNRFRDAVDALEASRALRPLPVVSYNLGLAYRGVGRSVDAVAAFARYLREPEPDAPPERLEALRREVERLTASLATLRIAVHPSSAMLRIDGRPVVIVDGQVIVDAGPRSLDVTADGYEPALRELDLVPGSRTSVEVYLVAVPRQARLLVEPSSSQANVFVDGRLMGVGETDVGLSMGRHTVAVSAPGFLPFERDVWSTGHGVLRVMATLVSSRPPAPVVDRRPWALPLAIGGGALLVVGIIAGALWLARGTEPTYNGRWGTFCEGTCP